MRSIAVIPARGGSKRLPRKNMLKVGDRTLVERCVDTCFQAGFDKVVVSTDNRRIGYMASSAGADVHIRWDIPDDDPSETSYLAVLKNNLEYEVCAMVQCTSPTLRHVELGEPLDQMLGLKNYRVVQYATYGGEECGAFYIARTGNVLRSGSRWGSPGTLRVRRELLMGSDINTYEEYVAACEYLGCEPEPKPTIHAGEMKP